MLLPMTASGYGFCLGLVGAGFKAPRHQNEVNLVCGPIHPMKAKLLSSIFCEGVEY